MEKVFCTDERFYDIQDLPGEVWKHHPDPKFAKYLFSDCGRVKSFHNYGGKDKILKQCPDGRGYPRVGPSHKGKMQSLCVHILVGQTFLDCKDGLGLVWTVDHIDECPKNNYIDNLRIIKRAQNTQRAHVKSVRLTNLKTGKHFDFQSITACGDYLGKSHGTIGKIISDTGKPIPGWKIERLEIEVDKILGIK